MVVNAVDSRKHELQKLAARGWVKHAFKMLWTLLLMPVALLALIQRGERR